MPFCISVPKHHSCLTIFLFQKSHHIWEVLALPAWGGIHHKTFQHSEFNNWNGKHRNHVPSTANIGVAISNQQPFPTLSMFVLAILLQDCVDALFGGFGRIMFVVELLSDRIRYPVVRRKRCRKSRDQPPMPRGSRWHHHDLPVMKTNLNSWAIDVRWLILEAISYCVCTLFCSQNYQCMSILIWKYSSINILGFIQQQWLYGLILMMLNLNKQTSNQTHASSGLPRLPTSWSILATSTSIFFYCRSQHPDQKRTFRISPAALNKLQDEVLISYIPLFRILPGHASKSCVLAATIANLKHTHKSTFGCCFRLAKIHEHLREIEWNRSWSFTNRTHTVRSGKGQKEFE